MEVKKEYISVTARFDKDKGILPVSIQWEGVEIPVDKVEDVRNAASMRVGGFGVRYTVRIQNKSRLLWLEEDKWFVEKRIG